MKVFVSHSKNFNFKDELYEPIRESNLVSEHEFFFPHDTDVIFNTKGAIQNVYEVILAEVSFPSTGQGIELGWAEDKNKKIICIYKTGSKPANSLKEISKSILEYSDSQDMINKIASALVA